VQVESIRQPVLTISERLDIVIEKEGLRTAGLNQHIGLMGKGNLRSEAAPNMRDIIIPALSQWATGRDPIRAVLLTSTRAIPDAPIDALSDYDVILIVHDIQPFVAERAWLNAFGELLVVYLDPAHAYVTGPPSLAIYQTLINDFLSDAPYVAKCLRRDELLPAKWCLDCDMKHTYLRQLLEWRMEMDHDWSVPAGFLVLT